MKVWGFGTRPIATGLLILAASCVSSAGSAGSSTAATPAPMATSFAADEKLGLGDHSRHPRHWRDLNRTAINILPAGILEQIRSILPGEKGDLWFSTGPTLQHIDNALHVSSITMQSTYWQVGKLTRSKSGDIWFTLFNAGRVGVLRNGRVQTYVLDPANRPGIYDLALDDDDSLWFGDDSEGRIDEFRGGRIVRRIAVNGPNQGSPANATACGSRIWFAGARGKVGFVDGDRARQFVVRAPGDTGYYAASLACGRGGRLWYSTATGVGWFDRSLAQRAFTLPGKIDAIAATPGGGIVAVTATELPYTLYRIAPDGKIERHGLPLVADGSYVSNVAVGADDTIWLSLDVPVTIVKLPPHEALDL